MTREELHELVDIVMDARERGIKIDMTITDIISIGTDGEPYRFNSFKFMYPTFSDFTQAVKEYIKSLGDENCG